MKEIKNHNSRFVANGEYEKFATSKFPDKKIAVVTCMDTRLVTLLPAAMGVKNGDVIEIKNAGGLVVDPYGDSMRSLLVAVYELGVESIMIMAHTDCGVEGLEGAHLKGIMQKRGLKEEAFDDARNRGVDLDAWLSGFSDTDCAVKKSVELVKNHPLLPEGIEVTGYVIDTPTGELREIQA